MQTQKRGHRKVKPTDDTMTASVQQERSVQELKQIKRRRAKLEIKEDELVGVVKNFMGAHTVLLSKDEHQLLATCRLHTQQQFDEKAFAKRHPKIYKRFLRTKEVNVLLIK